MKREPSAEPEMRCVSLALKMRSTVNWETWWPMYY